ncbi:ABC transporter permease subunit [Ancylobacter sp. WKF20]|uniref:ABC transporter permease subunit n=1 Tax=Ancylobacter sp. WKF20 TaxID=3039801 RepID=UPI0024342CF4|nr:ABC transporter permease subunit [Ancylobacter sp. WKF20]WGD32145.1 ABC transporter permease subunit [Ancylobacter sp. WKF20]
MTVSSEVYPVPGARGRWFTDARVSRLLTAAVALPLALFFLLPLLSILLRSFDTADGFGLGNFAATLSTARFWELVRNSVAMSALATVLAVSLAYLYAYGIQRTQVPGKSVLRIIALMPLFAPSLVQAQGLILLLGRNGALNRFFDAGIEIYGFWGTAIANLLYAFPYAFLILSAALAIADGRLYESATVMGAGPLRIFRTVTLPATRFGLAAAGFVVFTLVMTDFGNPMVIGGDFNVLATEIYNQVIGQAQFGLGAVIGVVLLVPAVIAKVLEKRLTRRQHALLTAQSVPLVIRPSWRRDLGFGVYLYTVAALMLSVVGVVIFASFVRLWPYNMQFTLKHYQFDVQNGIAPLWNSIAVALATALLGVLLAGAAAIVVNKFRNSFTGALSLLAVLPSAVPGMVLGLGYVLTFNNPMNPLNLLYGGFALIIILNVYYNHSQAFLISSTSLGQIGGSFDEASTMLGAGVLRTLWKVTLPLIWPTLLGIGVFYFMRAMVSLSAVIFLITPSTQVAAVSVLQLTDRGAVNQAAAFSVCIMAVVVACLLLVRLVLVLAGVRNVTLIR